MAQANKTASAATKTGRKDSVTSNTIATVKPSCTPLTAAEQQQLAKCENIIKKGIQAFLEVAAALLEVRDQELFRATHNNFQDYCAEKWGFTSRHANRLVLAGEVAKNVSEDQLVSGIPAATPQNEAQARELATLSAEKQVEVAREVAKTTTNPTAKDFKAGVAKVKQADEDDGDEVDDDEAGEQEEIPHITSYMSPPPPAPANTRKQDDGDSYDALLELVDKAQTQARITPGCADLAKQLGDIVKKVQQIKAKGAR